MTSSCKNVKVVIYFATFCFIENAVVTNAGPTECHACTEGDAVACSANQVKQTCATNPKSLGTTHCGSMAGKFLNQSGSTVEGFIRGCIDCADKKAACFALGGALKARKMWTLKKCELECCTGNNCNTQNVTLSQNPTSVFYTDAECNACVESDAASCNMNQQTQYCGTGEHSLGTTHCASAVGKFRDKSGNVVDGFYRGCIDCTDKMTACAAIGGALKARKGWSLEKCEIECCTGNKCNTQTPTLSDDTAIPVFLPPADGPSLQCHSCLDSQGGSCDSNQLQTQVCKDDQDSLGTRQCFSAVTQYRGQNGDLQSGATKGCIDCTDVKVACAAVGGLLKERQKWNVAQCEIVCCTGNKCNTQNPTLPYPGSGGSRTSTVKGTKPTEASGQQTQHALFSVGVLAFVNILYHF
ncbi:putative skeletal organic matrix protein 2 isoform X2 [Oculina patagonica]